VKRLASLSFDLSLVQVKVGELTCQWREICISCNGDLKSILGGKSMAA